ncbi:MAG: HDOD domain-containing protein [Planctomycetota bacterium]
MHKPRRQLTAGEQAELYESLGRKLDRVGIETQPEVAVKVLDLTRDEGAGANDFSELIRHDPALTARVLKTANSAYFAQVGEVASVRRACVVLGLERLRTLALGFYLSRAAMGSAAQELGRRVWTGSIFRGCLCAALGEELLPEHTAEAFAVGLLLDVGIPLMPVLLGESYFDLLEGDPGPSELQSREESTLPFTHADIASVLAERWRLPEVLARPLMWRYTPPRPNARASTTRTLHRIAYYGGATNLRHLSEDELRPETNTQIAEHALHLRGGKLLEAVDRARSEYELSMQMFGDVADRIDDLDAIAHSAHLQLVAMLERSVIEDAATRRSELSIGVEGCTVSIHRTEDGTLVALLGGENGEAILRHRFVIGDETPDSLLRSLGFNEFPKDAVDALNEYFRMAA